MMGENVKNNVY